ncbi:MAG: hypothetical protein HC836_49765 [Richelia sp. RM2_1_2]|nr:hypothetical protein [Richelia sp. RM2_1_2]
MKNNAQPNRNFLWENSHEGIVCLCCGKVLISYYRHDYKTCGCSNGAMIDGGQIDYVRRGAINSDLIQEVIVTPVFRTKNGKVSKKKVKSYRKVYSK